LVGSQAANAGVVTASAANPTVVLIQFCICFVPVVLLDVSEFAYTLRSMARRFKQISPDRRATFAAVRAAIPQRRHSGMRLLGRRPE
jgi:hypothetical protein